MYSSNSVASWPVYRFLKRQIRWSGIPISFRIFQFIVIHIVKGFGIVNKAEIDVFLQPSCFFHDPADVGNLISGSSAFSKASLNIRNFTVHILLKPGLENFDVDFGKFDQRSVKYAILPTAEPCHILMRFSWLNNFLLSLDLIIISLFFYCLSFLCNTSIYLQTLFQKNTFMTVFNCIR